MRPRADLATALARTDPGHYQRAADGAPYPWSTPPDVVRAMLRLLDLPRGAVVLEIGTGSGFATAVLSRAVGTDGLVHSVELDPDVADRARRRLAADGRTNTHVTTGDALAAAPLPGPVDRLVAFVSLAAEVPTRWAAAVGPGGLLVVPRRDDRRVVRYRRDPVSVSLHAERSIAATFGPASGSGG